MGSGHILEADVYTGIALGNSLAILSPGVYYLDDCGLPVSGAGLTDESRERPTDT